MEIYFITGVMIISFSVFIKYAIEKFKEEEDNVGYIDGILVRRF